MSSSFPFTFAYPSGCTVRQLGSTLVIIRQSPKFRLNLMKGPYSGHHGTPPGYKLLETQQLSTPKGKINLLVAFSPAYSVSILRIDLVMAIILGAISGTILFFLFGRVIPAAGQSLWILAASLLIMTYLVLRTDSRVKYAFIYEGFEYVFTGYWAQKTEIDELIASIRFT